MMPIGFTLESLSYCICNVYTNILQAAVCGGTSDSGHGSEPYEIHELFGLHNQLIASTAPFDVTYLSHTLQPIGRIRYILATCTLPQKVNTCIYMHHMHCILNVIYL
jgi:hypothetical protein